MPSLMLLSIGSCTIACSQTSISQLSATSALLKPEWHYLKDLSIQGVPLLLPAAQDKVKQKCHDRGTEDHSKPEGRSAEQVWS
jgi:hypothetical protein